MCRDCALVLDRELCPLTPLGPYNAANDIGSKLVLWQEWCSKTHQSYEHVYAINSIYETQIKHLRNINLRHRYSIAFYLATLKNQYPLELDHLAQLTGCKVKLLAQGIRNLHENPSLESQPLIMEHSRLFLQNIGLSKHCQKQILRTCRLSIASCSHLVHWKPLVASCILLHSCPNVMCQHFQNQKLLADILGCTTYSLQKTYQQIKRIDFKEFSASPQPAKKKLRRSPRFEKKAPYKLPASSDRSLSPKQSGETKPVDKDFTSGWM